MMMSIDQWLSMDRSPAFYKTYVSLFEDYYPGVDKKLVEVLNQAAYCHYHSLLLLDEVIDKKDSSSLAIRDGLQEQSVRLLTSVYGCDSPFWSHWKNRNQKVYQGGALDRKLRVSSQVDFEQYRELADLKSNAGLLAIDCLNFLVEEKDEDLYFCLLESHKCFSTAFQLYDDIKDFKEDWENEQFNWAVYQYKSSSVQQDHIGLSQHQKSFYLDGLASTLFALCLEQLEKALLILPPQTDSKWVKVCVNTQQELVRYRSHVKAYLMCLHSKQAHLNDGVYPHSLPDIPNGNSTCFDKGWVYVQRAYSRNWGDLPHWMWLSIEDGFSTGDQVKKGEVFQLALVWDCIAFAIRLSDPTWQERIKKEWTTILGLRSRRRAGAWAYFSDVPELADDIDDLAQVIQLMKHFGREDQIERYCTKAVELVLEHRSIEEGVWETWIVPIKNRTPLEEKQEWLNTRLWGRGPDVEVVANFAYSLFSWRPKQYCTVVKRSSDYLISQQLPEGYWKSRWYVGKLYGTYQCVRLIRLVAPQKTHVFQKALAFTLSMQKSDGGFSKDENDVSDPLSTAFALLILGNLGYQSSEVYTRALGYLKQSQNEDGSWAPCPFIIAKPGSIYKSAVMTTAWVIRAINETHSNGVCGES
jgi:hypothetical protein